MVFHRWFSGSVSLLVWTSSSQPLPCHQGTYRSQLGLWTLGTWYPIGPSRIPHSASNSIETDQPPLEPCPWSEPLIGLSSAVHIASLKTAPDQWTSREWTSSEDWHWQRSDGTYPGSPSNQLVTLTHQSESFSSQVFRGRPLSLAAILDTETYHARPWATGWSRTPNRQSPDLEALALWWST